MPEDRTELQNEGDRQFAQRMSAEKTTPPTQVPGYEIQRFLGAGAYGEVWVGVDQNTGRKVAIKRVGNVFQDLVDAKRILREIKLLRHLGRHRRVPVQPGLHAAELPGDVQDVPERDVP